MDSTGELLQNVPQNENLASWCLLCSAKVPVRPQQPQIYPRGRGRSPCHRQQPAPVSNRLSPMDPMLIRAWRQLFKLPHDPWLQDGNTDCCDSCLGLMNQIQATWVQLNEIYSRIGELHHQVVGVLQNANIVGVNANVKSDQQDKDEAGDKDKIRRRRLKLLEALEMSETFDVDQVALNYSKGKVQHAHQKANLILVCKSVDTQEQEPEFVEIKTEAPDDPDKTQIQLDPDFEFEEPASLHFNDDPPEPGSDPDPSDPDWVPSAASAGPSSPNQNEDPEEFPLSSLSLLNHAAVADSISLRLETRRERRRLQERKRRRPLSPDTASQLIDEIRTCQRLVSIPLKHVRWDRDEGRWIAPRFRNHVPTGYNPKWKQDKMKTRANKAAKAAAAGVVTSLVEKAPPPPPPPTQPPVRRRALRHKLVSQCIAMGAHLFVCRVGTCQHRFDTELRRDAHELRLHHGDPKPFKCHHLEGGVECGRAFGYDKNLQSHIKRYHRPGAPGDFICDHCGRILRSSEGLQRHIANVHGEGAGASGDRAEPLEQHLCPECGKVLHSTSGLRSHMAMHEALPPFPCNFCSEGFHRRDQRRRHVLLVHQTHDLHTKPEYRCRYCNKIFHDKHYVRRHEVLQHQHGSQGQAQASVVGAKMLHCPRPSCAYRCYGKYRLDLHEARHRNERLHRCHAEGCSASYNEPSKLRRHMRVHTGERPYKCDRLRADGGACTAAFMDSKHLSNHVRTVHEAHIARLHCELCGAGFPIRKYLTRHLEKHRDGKI